MGRCTLCTLSFFLSSVLCSEASSWLGGGTPSDLPSCPTHLPNTATYSTLGPLSQVNEINFENMSNDDAVRVLREIVHKPGYGWDGHYRRGGRHFWLSGKGFGLASTHPALTRDTLAFRPITLTVAKCWDPSPRGCFTLPRSKWMGDSVLMLVPGIREPCLSCLWCYPEPSHLPCRAWYWAVRAAPDSSSSLQASPSGPLTLRPGSLTLQP